MISLQKVDSLPTFQSTAELKVFCCVTGPEGLEPSTNCSAGSHSIQAELWAQYLFLYNNYDTDDYYYDDDGRNSRAVFPVSIYLN
jgi:hypothetical protein